MKPKERFLNYALLSSSITTTTATSNCESNNRDKEDIPIDLSVKKATVSLGDHHHHHIGGSNPHFVGLYKDYHERTLTGSFHHHHSHSPPPAPAPPPPPPPHIAEWPPAVARYCFPSNFATKSHHHHHHHHPHYDHYHSSNGIFPYLFIGNTASGCLPTGPGPGPTDIDTKKTQQQRDHHPATAATLLDHYVMPYRLAQDGILFPFPFQSANHHHRGLPDGNFHHPHHHHHHHGRQSEPHLPLSIESTSSSASSSPYEYHIPEYGGDAKGLLLVQSSKSSPTTITTTGSRQNKSPPTINNGGHIRNNHHHHHQKTTKQNGSQMTTTTTTYGSETKMKLKKSLSQSCLPTATIKEQIRQNIYRRSLYRSKSECNLHLIKSSKNSPSMTTPITPPAPKFCAPKKMFASNYYSSQKEKENSNKEEEDLDDRRKENVTKTINNGATKLSYRNYRKEVIECWDNERRDNESTNVTGKTTNNNGNILDLRTTNDTTMTNGKSVLNSREMNELPSSVKYAGVPDQMATAAAAMAMKQLPAAASMTHPLDLYKQYYYYLMQEPAFASRAAVAVAETYVKMLSNNNNNNNSNSSNSSPNSPEMEKLASTTTNHHHHGIIMQKSPTDKSPSSSTASSGSFDNGSLYETKRISPDCSQDRAELRSADTTNGNLIFDRKRISRPLTGKHVRHGTGASPSTLVSLRNMIQQRQKLKEIGKFDCSVRGGKGKGGNKRIKRK